MTFPGEALDAYLTDAPSLDEEGEEDTMTHETDPMLKLYAALETFRDHMGGPVRPNRQGQHGAMYADLAQLDEATDTPLREAGLVVTQATGGDPNWVTVTTTVTHIATGVGLSSSIAIRPDAPGGQAYGASLTYARRYGLMVALNLSVRDSGEDLDSLPPQPRNTAKAPPDPYRTAPQAAAPPPAAPQTGSVESWSDTEQTSKKGSTYRRLQVTLEGGRTASTFDFLANKTSDGLYDSWIRELSIVAPDGGASTANVTMTTESNPRNPKYLDLVSLSFSSTDVSATEKELTLDDIPF